MVDCRAISLPEKMDAIEDNAAFHNTRDYDRPESLLLRY